MMTMETMVKEGNYNSLWRSKKSVKSGSNLTVVKTKRTIESLNKSTRRAPNLPKKIDRRAANQRAARLQVAHQRSKTAN